MKVVIVAGETGIPAPDNPLKDIPEMRNELIESGVVKLMISEPRDASSFLKIYCLKSQPQLSNKYSQRMLDVDFSPQECFLEISSKSLT